MGEVLLTPAVIDPKDARESELKQGFINLVLESVSESSTVQDYKVQLETVSVATSEKYDISHLDIAVFGNRAVFKHIAQYENQEAKDKQLAPTKQAYIVEIIDEDAETPVTSFDLRTDSTTNTSRFSCLEPQGHLIVQDIATIENDINDLIYSQLAN